MANQPRYNPLASSDFFPDHRAARDPVPGTVPHPTAGASAATVSPASGEAERRWVASVLGLGASGGLNVAPVSGAAYEFPVPVDMAMLKRGRERYDIYCAVCHDRVGTGRGKIVERGYLHPPSYHIDRLRHAPLMHFYEVISNGYGGMPSYSDKLPPQDRWAIIAYVQALQLSQDAPFADLPPDLQDKARKRRGQP